MEQIEATSNDLVKEMPSLKALGKDLAAQEAAVEKQLAAVRTEAELSAAVGCACTVWALVMW